MGIFWRGTFVNMKWVIVFGHNFGISKETFYLETRSDHCSKRIAMNFKSHRELLPYVVIIKKMKGQ